MTTETLTEDSKYILIQVTPTEKGADVSIKIKNMLTYEIIGLLEQTILDTKLKHSAMRREAKVINEEEDN